jgi:diguanylate cyclase (GGDEF)-like protein
MAGAAAVRPAATAHAPGPEGLAAGLAGTLPAGSAVVVRWRDPRTGDGLSESAGASTGLHAHAEALLDGRTPPDDAAGAVAGGVIDEAWGEAGGPRVAVAARAGVPLAAASREAWLALARRTVAATLAAAAAEARIEALQKSQRLQQALYEIADLSGSGLEMQEMLGRIHAVVGRLMYAENFYIVLYDDVRDAVRFLYFADRLDPYVAEPEADISITDIPNSLTVALLRHGQPLLGPSARLRQEMGVTLDVQHGPDSADWLGVPMRREGRVAGAIVVQSYDHPASYSDEDRALLEYVAQHIMTALDRKHARVELERRVDERTLELQQANLVLQAQIIERQRAERLQRALYRITELSVVAGSLERFYADVHGVVGELLFARNFYIALLTPEGDQIAFPYSVDERDAARTTRKLGKGLTEYVIVHGEPLLADRARIAELEAAGDVRSHGALAHSWLGVPLLRDSAVVGAIAVQSYSHEIEFSGADQELLTFVAHHIGGGLGRKRAQEHLKAAHAELEFRVESRTQELADANRELRAQIGERVRAEQRLTHQARHDALTGLPNRAHLLERLDAAIGRARADEVCGFSVLFLDLDRFKLINDSIGHAAGDEMLVEIGRRIASVLGERSIVARFGGDEFAILAEGICEPPGSTTLAARVLDALGRPLWLGGRELFPSASIGIAHWAPRYRLGEELLRDADAAMYRAKAEGRDRSAVFDEDMRAHATRLLDLEADLRRAIINESFVPYFQPIVRLADHAIVGYEALLRWEHELHGALPPGEFIGVGEDSGLIEQVDWLVYERVIDWLRRSGEAYVSINVSPRHFRADDFADRLLRMLDAAGADPRRLRIEITEVALLDDAPRALRMLNKLRERGVQALLDDFGTGFSALSYLHRFPIQSLKIDRSFVSGLDGETQAESLALVRAILALAGTLGIDTIGEGIETPEQRDILAELGCQFGQGFFYGKPAPVG